MPKSGIPWWKHTLSYLSPIKLEDTSSDHNELLRVVLSKGRYQLLTKNAIYSYDDLYSNFRDSFKQVNLPCSAQVLVLGLGLGSIPFMLENSFKKSYNYTCVEIDEEIIRLAYNYSLADMKSPINFISQDALQFVAFESNKYDLITMDIFVDDYVPEEFQSLDFLAQLKNLLHKDGQLFFNRLTTTPKDLQITRRYYESIFTKIFPYGKYFDVSGNWVLYAKN